MATPEPSEDLLDALGATHADALTRLARGKFLTVGSSNPKDVATRYWQTLTNSLRFYQGEPYLFQMHEGRYRVKSCEDFLIDVARFVEELYTRQTLTCREHFPASYADQIRPRPVRKGFISDVVVSLQAANTVDADLQLPVWIGSGERRTLLSMANGRIDVDQLLRDRTVIPESHSPQWFTVSSLPFRYEPGATCKDWQRFLNQVLEGDSQRIDLLQEWFGYCLLPDPSQHKFLLLEGTGANGKSVVVHVLIGLLGHDNVSSVPLEAFGGRFALGPTHGKLLNVCAEASALPPLTEGLVKQFVASDMITVDRKYVNALTFRPTARILITTNRRPRVSDDSDGFWRRMIILPFRVTIPEERQERDLPARLLREEASGIFNWAVEGLRRLRRQERFTVPKVSSEALAEAKVEDNPVAAFAKDHLAEETCGEVPVGEVFSAYLKYCETTNQRKPTEADFGKSLRRLFPKLDKVQRRRGKARIGVYTGIRFSDSELAACDGTPESSVPAEST
jgi:P4 family phage/plasmid primase-like protien